MNHYSNTPAPQPTATAIAEDRRFARRISISPTSQTGTKKCAGRCAHAACLHGAPEVRLDIQVRNDFWITVVSVKQGPAFGTMVIGDTVVALDANGEAAKQYLVDPLPAPLTVTVADLAGRRFDVVFASTTD